MRKVAILLGGVALNLLLNITAGLLGHADAIRLTRWGWLFLALYATYLLLTERLIKQGVDRLRLKYGGRKMLSYVVVGLLGASLSMLYWATINGVYSKIFPTEGTVVPEKQPLTISPQAISLSESADSTLNYDVFIHNTEDVTYCSVEVEVAIDSPTIKPQDVQASQTATMQFGDPSTNLLDIFLKVRVDKDRNAYFFMIPRIGPRETKRMLLSRSPVNGLSKNNEHTAKLRISSYSQEPVNFTSFSIQNSTPTPTPVKTHSKPPHP